MGKKKDEYSRQGKSSMHGGREAQGEQPEPKWGPAGQNGQVGYCQTGALGTKLSEDAIVWIMEATGVGLLRKEEGLWQSSGRRLL